MNAQHLTLDAYYADFDHNYRRPGTTFWKFERGQYYAEPANPSWVAFNEGNWDTALELIEAERDRLVKHHEQLSERGVRTHRVRVVSTPLTPYVQWELHYLNLRHQTGGPVRIYPVHPLAPLEHYGLTLPDLNICAPHAIYIPGYDQNGVLEHATKYPWSSTITSYIESLYQMGKPIDDFFNTHIAPLPPPEPTTSLCADYLEQHGRPQPPCS